MLGRTGEDPCRSRRDAFIDEEKGENREERVKEGGRTIAEDGKGENETPLYADGEGKSATTPTARRKMQNGLYKVFQ